MSFQVSRTYYRHAWTDILHHCVNRLVKAYSIKPDLDGTQIGKCKWREMVAVMKYQCIRDYTITCNNYNYIMHSKNSHFTAFLDQYLSSAKQFGTKLNCTLCILAAHGVHVIVAPQSLTVNIKRHNFFIVLDIVQLLFSTVSVARS